MPLNKAGGYPYEKMGRNRMRQTEEKNADCSGLRLQSAFSVAHT